MAIEMVTIDRKSRGGRYGDILDVCDALSRDHGSATNALANLVWESPRFQETLARLRENESADRQSAVGT